jgi:hypothetical protein
MPRTTKRTAQYDPDGELVPAHDHNWVMVQMVTHPGVDAARPIIGCTILWRCSKRNCVGYREVPYNFRRPRSNQQSNTYSPTLTALLSGAVRVNVADDLTVRT